MRCAPKFSDVSACPAAGRPAHSRGLSRREWLAAAGTAGLAVWFPQAAPAAEETERVRHIPLSLSAAPDREPADGLLTGFQGFGWQSFAIGEPGAPPTRLAAAPDAVPRVTDDADCRLRLTNAIDVRDVYRIDASLPDGQPLGSFDLRFAGLYQVQELPLTPDQARQVLAQGVRLRMSAGPQPVWFFGPSPAASPPPDVVQLPHVLVARGAGPRAEFERRLLGLVMLQGFGWQSGCVSEGVLDLAEARSDRQLQEAVDRQLAMYFTDTGVFFESPRSRPMRDRVGGIEEPLPWATLARRQPDHPAIALAVDFLLSRTDSDPIIARGGNLTTEGNYTAAYPTAVLARTLGRDDLADLALRQLANRRIANVHQGDIYQRANPAGQGRLRNWCRGVCWYYLGIVRTLLALQDESAVSAWQAELQRVAAMLRRYQRADGLWSNFLHDAQALPDTSGSAGLAAALARAHQAGWLDPSARQAAERTYEGLTTHLTPDGLLGGAAQSNKGGDALQHSDYRVLYQMGMGLKAQLMAALES